MLTGTVKNTAIMNPQRHFNVLHLSSDVNAGGAAK
jgi:hypothetical protein